MLTATRVIVNVNDIEASGVLSNGEVEVTIKGLTAGTYNVVAD